MILDTTNSGKYLILASVHETAAVPFMYELPGGATWALEI